MMASVSADSELLKNYVSARYMTAGKEFQNVLDEKRRPMVFSISSGDIPKLQLSESSKKLNEHLAKASGSQKLRWREP